MNQLKNFFSYKKFAQSPFKIIFLDKAYFLQKETIAVLKSLGHTVVALQVQDDPKQMLDNLLKTCLQVKPDFIMGTNHIGFDPDGKIANVLNELNLPVLFWYLDDFRFIIPHGRNQALPNIAVFSFEKTDLPDLRKFGFEHVFYMPAGSPLQPDADFSDPAFSYLQDRISFVGNTFLDAQERWFHPRYPELYEKLDFTKWDAHQKTLVDFIIEEQVTQFSSEGELFHYAGYVAGRSTMENRIELLKQISNPVVFGDRHWPELGLNVEIHPPVHPAETAPKIFKASQINLNISSTQLHTSVNQRVFDVPLSDGFLLTDWRESLAELFDPEKELAVYNSEEELKDKIDYYKNHDTERNKITTRAAERVEKEHLLEHRIQKMLVLMKKTFQ